jgi:tetratricopeptide (TPR) repeat protein
MSAWNDRNRLRWGLGLLALAGLALLLWLAWPSAASAYHVERAGRWLASGGVGSRVAQHLDQALRWDPDNAQAYRLRAELYQQQGGRVAAAEAWASYVALRPADPLGLWALVTACEQLPVGQLAGVLGQPCGRDDDGRQAVLVRLWRSAGYSAATFLGGADQLRQDGKLEEAEALYKKAMIMEPLSLEAWLGLGDLYLAQDELDLALETYARAAELSSEPLEAARAHARRGTILVAERRWQEAQTEFGQALLLDPDEGEYHLQYGWSLYKADGDPDEARLHIVEAAKLMPQNPYPALRLAELDLAAADAAAALVDAREVVRLAPELVWGWLLQGRALVALDRLAEAEPSFRRAVELAPQTEVAYAELGDVLRDLGRLEEAREAYESAAELQPRDAHYQLILAELYRTLGYEGQALEAYRRVLRLDPDNEVAQDAVDALKP